MSDKVQTKKAIMVQPDNKSVPIRKEKQVPGFTVDQRFELAKDGVQIGNKLLDLAGIYLQGRELSQQREDERATLLLEIEQEDAQAAAYCRKIDADMEKAKEVTERLRIICEFLKSRNVSEENVNSLITNFSLIS